MNNAFRTTPRFAALAFSAFMTLVMLLGVGGLAEHASADVQMAQATAAQHRA